MLRPVYFLAKVFLLLAGAGILGISLWIISISRPTPARYASAKQRVEQFIGFYENYDAGNRAALQYIAFQIRRYPNAQHYVAHYEDDWLEKHEIVITYDRDSKQLLGGESFCGCGSGYDNVTDKMIQEVAAKRGSMSDFEGLGGVSYP